MQGTDRYSVYRRPFGNRFFVVGVSALVIVIAMNWLVDRLDLEFERAESVQFMTRLAELHAAVTLMQASVVAKGESRGLEKFVGSNPMDWIEGDASHYLGLSSLSLTKGAAGNWVYDPELKVIAYLPKAVSRSFLMSEAGIGGDKLGNDIKDEIASQWLRFEVVGLFSKDSQLTSSAKVSSLELRFIADH